jgi:hypothetical protein
MLIPVINLASNGNHVIIQFSDCLAWRYGVDTDLLQEYSNADILKMFFCSFTSVVDRSGWKDGYGNIDGNNTAKFFTDSLF